MWATHFRRARVGGGNDHTNAQKCANAIVLRSGRRTSAGHDQQTESKLIVRSPTCLRLSGTLPQGVEAISSSHSQFSSPPPIVSRLGEDGTLLVDARAGFKPMPACQTVIGAAAPIVAETATKRIGATRPCEAAELAAAGCRIFLWCSTCSRRGFG